MDVHPFFLSTQNGRLAAHCASVSRENSRCGGHTARPNEAATNDQRLSTAASYLAPLIDSERRFIVYGARAVGT